VKTHFTGIVDLQTPIVDADAHVHEPPDLWQERVPAKWRERAPRVIHGDDGDVWSFDDGAKARPVGLSASVGLNVTQFRSHGLRYADMRPGAYESKARLDDLDIDGIDAQVLYPSVALEGARLYTGDRGLQLACVRAYNEWLAEFCEDADGRLVGLAVMPATSVDDAIEELEVAIALGHRGFLLSQFPNGTMDPDPDDDRFWSAASDAGLPAAVHLGSFMRPRVKHWPDMTELSFLALAGAAKGGAHAIEMACTLIFSGVLERFGDLRVLLVEAGIGWIPTLVEQLDTMFLRYRWIGEHVDRMRVMPSELFHRNVWTTFITDRVGLEHLDRINAGHVMWSTDYPHDTTDWPNSRVTIESQLRVMAIEDD
jgi:predicted TIM-barrel fold metal-dependent hydrolase